MFGKKKEGGVTSSMEERRASLADGVKAVAVDGKTELARWFVAGVQRAQVRNMAGAIVGKGKPGEFLVRDKDDAPDCYALTIKAYEPGQSKTDTSPTDCLYTYMIEYIKMDKRPGYQLVGSHMRFHTVSGLIRHYTLEVQPDLGIKLKYPGKYLTEYMTSGYSFEQKKEMKRIRSVRMARSKNCKGEVAEPTEPTETFAVIAEDDDDDDDDEDLVSGFENEDEEEAIYALAAADPGFLDNADDGAGDDEATYDLAGAGAYQQDEATYDLAGVTQPPAGDAGEAVYDMAGAGGGEATYDMAGAGGGEAAYDLAGAGAGGDAADFDEFDATGAYDNVGVGGGLTEAGCADQLYSTGGGGGGGSFAAEVANAIKSDRKATIDFDNWQPDNNDDDDDGDDDLDGFG